MGCLIPKRLNDSQDKQDLTNKTYSWSNRNKSQQSKFIIENEFNSIQIRMPGEINGEQFIIQNCKNSTICLFDFSNTVLIDDCHDCTIFVGPIIGSLVLRNCQSCRLMSASQQFRSRDCKHLDLYIFCATQPAIESCNDLTFACFSANYKGLREQFEKANLKIYNNKWYNVYDFSAESHDKHWRIISLDNHKINKSFCTIPLDDSINLSFNPITSLVPNTEGISSFESLKSELLFEVNQTSNEQFILITIYNHSFGATNKNSIEYQVGKIIQDLSSENFILMATRYADGDLFEIILDRILCNEMKLARKDDRTISSSNQLIVLLFRGYLMFDKIYENCQRVLNSEVTEIQFKIMVKNQNELFNDYISLLFENSF